MVVQRDARWPDLAQQIFGTIRFCGVCKGMWCSRNNADASCGMHAMHEIVRPLTWTAVQTG